MPESSPLSISDLLTQEEPKTEDIVDAVRDYAKRGIAIELEEFKGLVGKARLDGLDLTLMYQSLVKAATNKEIKFEVRQKYGDIVMYLQEKIDTVNPMSNK